LLLEWQKNLLENNQDKNLNKQSKNTSQTGYADCFFAFQWQSMNQSSLSTMVSTFFPDAI